MLKVSVNIVNICPAKINAADGPDQKLDAQYDTEVTVCPPDVVVPAFCHTLMLVLVTDMLYTMLL